MFRRRSRPLVLRVILLQTAILLLAVGAAGAALANVFYRGLETQYGQLSVGVARSVASDPDVREAFGLPDPASVLQPLAERVRHATGVAFVVIVNREQLRYSHPDPTKVGQRVSTDASEALHGEEHITTERGTLGVSVRGKVPVYNEAGQVIGAVSVGVLMQTIRQIAAQSWATIGGVVAASLLVGILGSVVLAFRLKSELLGHEPVEIAAVFQQREAMLQSMREGVIAVDRAGCITSINDEGLRLLGLDAGILGQPVAEVLPTSRLPDAVRTGQQQFDEMLVQGGRILVANSVPMLVWGEIVGAVLTFRDHTEVDGLARELANVRQYAEALRAQSHEFINKLHTIAGMLELGWISQAVSYIAQTQAGHHQRHEAITRYIQDPEVAAVLIGKAGVAAERGVTLSMHPSSRLRSKLGMSDELITILGNLVQNALEEVANLESERRRVTVTIRDRAGMLQIRVRDRGPGVPVPLQERIFEPGFTTKSAAQRGIGLSLVKGLVTRLGGTIGVQNNRGAIFTVTIPLHQRGVGDA